MVEVTVAEVLATGSCCCCLVAVLRPLAVEADCEAMMRAGGCEKKTRTSGGLEGETRAKRQVKKITGDDEGGREKGGVR